MLYMKRTCEISVDTHVCIDESHPILRFDYANAGDKIEDQCIIRTCDRNNIDLRASKEDNIFIPVRFMSSGPENILRFNGDHSVQVKDEESGLTGRLFQTRAMRYIHFSVLGRIHEGDKFVYESMVPLLLTDGVWISLRLRCVADQNGMAQPEPTEAGFHTAYLRMMDKKHEGEEY